MDTALDRINEQMANAQRQRAEGIAAVQRGQAYDSITQQQRQQAYDTWQSARQPGILPQPRSDMRQQEAEKAYSDTLAGRIGVATPSSPPEQLAKQLGGIDRHHAQNVQLQAAGRTPEQARAEAAEQPTGQQVPGLSGVYKHGEGQYSDNAQGMGLPQNLGQPSTQNMQAANNLAGQEQKRSMMSVMREQQERQQQAAAQPSFQMPRQESAYEREARQRERNRIMGMLQTPMTGDPRRDLTASQRQQLVAQLGQEGQERQATERNLVDFARQQMSDQTQRYSTDASTGVGQQRNLIDAARLGMDQQTQGFANRAAQRRENILLRYDNAKTAQERAQIQQEHAEVFGKSEVDPYLVVPGGQQLNENGQAYTAPSAVFNRRTGDWLRQPGVAQLPSIDQNPQAIAIKNDTTMSKLQKMEALRKLGYS